MAYTILWMDGFDEIGDASQKYVYRAEYDGFVSIYNSAPPYNYGRYVGIFGGGTSWVQKALSGSSYTELFIHLHVRIQDVVAGEKGWIYFRDEQNNVVQFEVRLFYDSVNAYYLLRLYRGSTLVATSSFGIPPTIWTSLSIKYVCNATTGQCSILLNGISAASYSGNTQNGPSAQVHGFRFQHSGGNPETHYDNLVIATGLTSDPPLPECRIIGAVVPTSNFSTSFTPNAGTNWSNVNEIPPNDDTSYNYSNTVGAKDMFVCAPPTVSGAVLAVKVGYKARKDDAGQRYVKAVIRPGSTDHDGAQATQPYTTYFGWGEVWQTNPDTSVAWTPGDLANLKFGYKIHS
jgi:hypothetical protein